MKPCYIADRRQGANSNIRGEERALPGSGVPSTHWADGEQGSPYQGTEGDLRQDSGGRGPPAALRGWALRVRPT